MTASCAFEQQPNVLWRGMEATPSSRAVAEEAAIALTYGGSTYAVMMATPADLEELAVGFSLTEGIVERAEEIERIEIVQTDLGMEVQMWLTGHRSDSFVARRRAMVGPVGCGLCGVESLEQAQRPPRRVSRSTKFRAAELLQAMRALAPQQRLFRLTRAVHAAGFWQPSSGVALLREDVGRHNAIVRSRQPLVQTRRQ
jgi:FdhD protein